MTHLDYTWEKREKLIRKEEYEDGKAAGRAEGRTEGRLSGIAESIIKLLADEITSYVRLDCLRRMCSTSDR